MKNTDVAPQLVPYIPIEVPDRGICKLLDLVWEQSVASDQLRNPRQLLPKPSLPAKTDKGKIQQACDVGHRVEEFGARAAAAAQK